MLKRVDFRSIFNQAYSIDVGSSHVVLANQGGQSILREPCLISQIARKAAPRRASPPKALRAGRPARDATAEPNYRLLAIGADVTRPAPGEENGIRLVHPVDHGRIADVNALELVMRKVMEDVNTRALRKLLFGVRVTLLSALHLEERERQPFNELLRDFGFGRIRTVEAPVAAAQGAGLPVERSLGQMLIDVGGGQTTVATFTLGSIVCWHWAPTGGRDLDEAIGAYVLRRHRMRLDAATAEWIKLQIGSVYPRTRPETLEIGGFDTETGVEKKVTLDDNELRDVLLDACEPLVMAIHQGFESVPPELAADIAQGEILLVGGGALLAGLPAFLSERTGLRYRVAVDPINAAIRGAFALP